MQVELVEALCDGRAAGGKLFFVGDYKQSIYRFRGAEPHVFRRLRERDPAGGRLPLSLNFRSQPAVLDFVNALFCEADWARNTSRWSRTGRRSARRRPSSSSGRYRRR